MTQNQMIESQPFELNEFAFDAVSDEAWADSNKPKTRPLEEGQHTLRLSKIRNLGKDKIDTSWYSLAVEVTDDNGTRYSGIVKMPTNSPVFTREGKASSWEMVKFKSFATALGLDVSDQKKVQNSLGKLVDGIMKDRYLEKAIAVELGFTGDHLKFISPGCYQVVDNKGVALAGAPETFSDAASANEWYGATRDNNHKGEPRKLQYIQVKRFGDSKLATK